MTAIPRDINAATNARELYVDLLIRSLLDGIYGDHMPGPWLPGKKFTRGPKVEGVLGPSVAHTMVGLDRLNNVRELVQSALDQNIPGDSFEGLPRPNPEAYSVDIGNRLYEHTELAVSLEKVKDNFNRYGLLNDQVVFVKGFFSETLPALQAVPFALIRLDGDLYESTYVALEQLIPK